MTSIIEEYRTEELGLFVCLLPFLTLPIMPLSQPLFDPWFCLLWSTSL